MSQFEEDKFKEEWRSAFDDAAETPPDRVWDAIARQLDEDEKSSVVPLWASPWTRFRPWAYGAAAAVIAIVVGWWAIRSINQAESEQVAADRPRQEAPVIPGKAENQKSTPKTADPEVSSSIAAIEPKSPQPEGLASRLAKPLGSSAPFASTPKNSPLTTTSEMALANRLATNRRAGSPASSVLESDPTGVVNSISSLGLVPQPLVAREADAEAMDQRLAYEATRLNGKGIVSKRIAMNRVVWYRQPEAEATIRPHIKKHSKKELWASLSATPMSFNPMASVGQPKNTLAYTVVNNVVQPGQLSQSSSLIENRSQVSMAWQAGGGVKLNKHWSVETGVQYLNGRSQARNNASMANAFTKQSESVLANAVRNSSPSIAANTAKYASPATADMNSALVNPSFTAVIPAEDLVSNNFQYLQVPVQLGYHIQPGRKMNYAVLGGLVTNVFLQNTIDGSLEVRPEDQVYRPVLLAGSAGLRINYQPTEHWSGSVTGSYQQALQTGTRSTAQLRTKPQAVGVGVGMNYHF